MAWTEKMVEDLRIMWKQGLTTGEIGRRLGVSKNSIVGKVHRLQLDARPSPIKKKTDNAKTVEPAAAEKKTKLKTEKPAEKKAEKSTSKAVKAPEKKAVASTEKKSKPVAETPKAPQEKKQPTPKIPEHIFTPKPAQAVKTYNGNAKLTDLDNHTCRWPLGDPKDENFHFCGRRVKVGQTYCEEHAALAYVKPSNKK